MAEGMATTQELIAHGKELKLEGGALLEFVSKQQALQRQDRAEMRAQQQAEAEAQREHEKQMEELKLQRELAIEKEKRATAEREDSLLKERLEMEELKLQRELAIEKEKRATAEREDSLLKERLEMEQQAALKEHLRKLELAEVEDKKPLGSYQATSTSTTKGPKLPPFEEGKDNMDAYISRFERYAVAQKWEKANWGANLSALLKGRALDVFCRLPVERALDYDMLKTALLKRFELTEEGFRKKFRSARPEAGETFSQFAIRLDSYFQRWIEMAETTRDFASLKDLMIRDQFLHCCGKELSLFLKERVPRSLNEMSKLADQFAEARNTTSGLMTGKTGSNRGDRLHASSQNNTAKSDKAGNSNKTCYACGKQGHMSYDCKNKKTGNKQIAAVSAQDKHNLSAQRHTRSSPRGKGSGTRKVKVREKTDGTVMSLSDSCDSEGVVRRRPVTRGYVGDQLVTVLRDSGSDGIVVRRSLVEPSQMTGRTQVCYLVDKTPIYAPVAKVFVDTPFYTGHCEAWTLETPLYDLIIGNISGAREPSDPDPDWRVERHVMQAVETRAQRRGNEETYRPMKVPAPLDDEVSVEELKRQQQNDPSLEKVRTFAEKGDVFEKKPGILSSYYERKGILYRRFKSEKFAGGKEFKQVVVPDKLRVRVMKMAHESILAGHLGIRRTVQRVLTEFFWPGLQADVTRFCRSCDICQRTFPKGRVPKAPLGSMPLIDTPFKRVAVDLVGPLDPPTQRKNRYILTVVDYATRYPEAVPLPGIEAERVAEALVDIFSRVGIPSEMLTDQGAQFTSAVMEEVSRLLSFRRLTTTPYHPMCNGLVERFNGTLKQMLRRMCAERPRDWDKYINALLFAYREVPQESMGFSPFELLYGRTIRGPMMILRELWTKDLDDDEEVKTTYQYVVDLRERLNETCRIASDSLKMSKVQQRKYYNRKAKLRDLKKGDKVLVLLPTKANKLLMQWRGPFIVEGKKGSMDYQVRMQDGKVKTLHVNLLKRYVDRDTSEKARRKRKKEPGGDAQEGVACIGAVVVEEDGDTPTEMRHTVVEAFPRQERKETVGDVVINSDLPSNQEVDVKRLLEDFEDILTDVPGRTSVVEHDILTTTKDPVKVRPYPIPFSTKETIKEEIDKMLEIGVIEPSSSPYAAPVVIVKKKDGTNRFCIDFRQLNRVTVFDSEPMPSTEDMFSRLAGYHYFSKLDLTKGYWQVPMAESAKEKTAFITPVGLFQFRVMPFGLVNAPASFCRLMRKVLKGLQNTDSFVDDILIYTRTFEEHLIVLKELFERLRKAGLTARPSKCFMGFRSLDCLGHVVGDERLQPQPQKIRAIEDAPRPGTKTQLRSFLGLVGFYRKFIANFAAIAVPLTELTKKGLPNKLEWGDPQEKAFLTLKKALTSKPILKLPDLHKQFILRTDASDSGLGAILLQMEEDQKMPIAYASRKLLARERAYAVVEKECLAIVWAVQKFEQYLYGKEFVLETDHQPLVYLQRAKIANGRLMRWALLLQPYRFRISAIKGKDNIGADYCSRV
ncbi:uncharacterized protein LOC132550192 [Ylistrum balloti]|uniref:uncharacterized protein LOC132550192 n=1 Tax=Ylistrum balloti TaxID=509963 RepID=UPI002905D063|nr:uncharacterized protein LOC132550192 [Ylistrum balloti]